MGAGFWGNKGEQLDCELFCFTSVKARRSSLAGVHQITHMATMQYILCKLLNFTLHGSFALLEDVRWVHSFDVFIQTGTKPHRDHKKLFPAQITVDKRTVKRTQK